MACLPRASAARSAQEYAASRRPSRICRHGRRHIRCWRLVGRRSKIRVPPPPRPPQRHAADWLRLLVCPLTPCPCRRGTRQCRRAGASAGLRAHAAAGSSAGRHGRQRPSSTYNSHAAGTWPHLPWGVAGFRSRKRDRQHARAGNGRGGRTLAVGETSGPRTPLRSGACAIRRVQVSSS